MIYFQTTFYYIIKKISIFSLKKLFVTQIVYSRFLFFYSEKIDSINKFGDTNMLLLNIYFLFAIIF